MARIRIGSMLIGGVKRHNGELVKTKFFLLGVPLWPQASYYLDVLDRGCRIKLDAASVVAGYLRIYSILGIFAGVALALDKVLSNQPVELIAWIVGSASLAVCLLSLFVMGRADPITLSDRTVLKAVLGLGVLPSMLCREDLLERFAAIREAIGSHGLAVECGMLAEKQVAPNLLPMVYALALFGEAARPGEPWGPVAAAYREAAYASVGISCETG